MSRVQLTPGTSHGSTRYEVEWWSKISKAWALDLIFPDLEAAKVQVKLNRRHNIDSRIVVVSETRRIAEQ